MYQPREWWVIQRSAIGLPGMAKEPFVQDAMGLLDFSRPTVNYIET
jgi:hypothetical protein